MKIPYMAFAAILAMPTAAIAAQEEAPHAMEPAPIPEKTVVLTFDDSVKSHRSYVGPLLKYLGFGATFFVTHAWMDDTENFMSWQDVAELHEMGFEIGNHTWTHAPFNTPENAEKLEEELRQVDEALADVGVPKPVSFAWPGNAFGPEALEVLRNHGMNYARRGMQPEQPYGEIRFGPLFKPGKYDPLLIPTSCDAYPDWTMAHFKKLVAQAKEGKAVVLQFHGVPDEAHPWVHTPPEMFDQYMRYLKDEGYNVIAFRDLAQYMVPPEQIDDPTRQVRYPELDEKKG